MEEENKKELEKINKQIKEKRQQPDPYKSHKRLYNPSTGDLYVSVTDSNGNIRRKVVNLLGD